MNLLVILINNFKLFSDGTRKRPEEIFLSVGRWRASSRRDHCARWRQRDT